MIKGGECVEQHLELCQGGRFVQVVWYCEEVLGGQGHYVTGDVRTQRRDRNETWDKAKISNYLTGFSLAGLG